MYQYKMVEVLYKTAGILVAKGTDEKTAQKMNEILENMGREGWELVEVKTTMFNAYTNSVLLFFRKEVK